MPGSNGETQGPRSDSLVAQLSEVLRNDIVSGNVKPGERLPSEAELTRTHSVSRTVVREAIAALRSDGLVEARRGSGVYALDHSRVRLGQAISGIDASRITSIIELLEVRIAFEIRSAGLAATRRSNAQTEEILARHKEVSTLDRADLPTGDADFRFHLAIAEATQNSLFPQFLALIRPGMVPRKEIGRLISGKSPVRNSSLVEEHRKIVEAIIDQDCPAAEGAMAEHLEGTLKWYRAVLRESISESLTETNETSDQSQAPGHERPRTSG